MPGSPGYLATVKRGGTPTAMSGEAMTLVSGNTYQIDDLTKRIWDPTATFVFSDGGGGSPQTLDASDILSIDYLFGAVTFTSAKTGPIEVESGTFIPVVFISGAHSYNLNQGGDVLDDTDFELAQGNNGRRTRILGLRDVSVTTARHWQPTDVFKDAINNRTRVLIEVIPGGGTIIARGWFVTESEEHTGDVAALEAGNLAWQLDGDVLTDFGWSDQVT